MNEPEIHPMPGSRRDYLSALLLCLAVLLATCWGHCRWSLYEWSVPLHYGGDPNATTAQFRAVAEGQALPFLPQIVERLNAPFGANWNDYPRSEELMYVVGGLATLFVGPLAAINLVYVLNHLLSGLCAYLAARLVGANRSWSWLLGFSFGLNHFSFQRHVGHLQVGVSWHVPLFWAAAYHLHRRTPLGRKSWLALFGLCFVTGWLSPYYWFCWLLLLAALALPAWLQGDRPQLKRLLTLLAASVLSFATAQLDSFLGWYFYGRGASFNRGIEDLFILGLRLPDLFLPYSHHFSELQHWAHHQYYQALEGRAGEQYSAYLGVLGAVALVWLFVDGVRRLILRRPGAIWAALMGWLLAMALTGGGMLLLGVGGFKMVRATNRFSIVINGGCLVWLGWKAAQSPRLRRAGPVLAALSVPLVCFDQIPYYSDASAVPYHVDRVRNDQSVVDQLQHALPAGSMVFQWPAVEYPEAPHLYELRQYDQFSLYYLSRSLRFSYGNCRGRSESEWQNSLYRLHPAALSERLRAYGFRAIVVYPKGLSEGERRDWETYRKPDFVSPDGDRWLYPIAGPPGSQLPPILPVLEYRKWFNPERSDYRVWRRTLGEGYVHLRPARNRPWPKRLTFDLQSIDQDRSFRITWNGATAWTGVVPSASALRFSVRVDGLPPQEQRIGFQMEEPRSPNPNGALKIENVEFSES